MSPHATAARRLSELLDLPAAPVAVSFDTAPGPGARPVDPQPAGCCFWEPAQQQRLDTGAADHAHCSVGSYTHGLIPIEQAAAGEETAALVGSGWVAGADLAAAAAPPFTPAAITYQPLAEAGDPDVVLVRLSAKGLMTLHSAVPGLTLASKPQCMIVPLAQSGHVAVSPGCAVSRTRTGLPPGALTCAIPARELASILDRLEATTAADHAVSAFAAADIATNFSKV